MEFMNFAAAVAVIAGLVEAVKRAGLPTRFAAVLAVVLGAVAGLVLPIGGDELSTAEAVFVGVAAGLSAAGLYSGAKATLGR
jgi:hypothetical protein